MTDGKSQTTAALRAEIERLRFTLRVIADLPVSYQDDMMAANMRKLAREALNV